MTGASLRRDPHSGPVPPEAWAADEASRRVKGRVEIMNATRPGGLDGWTMDESQWVLMRDHILGCIDDCGDEDGTVLLKDVVEMARERFGSHPAIPTGNVRNYVTYTKVDLEARCEVERIAGSSPQRITRWRPTAH